MFCPQGHQVFKSISAFTAVCEKCHHKVWDVDTFEKDKTIMKQNRLVPLFGFHDCGHRRLYTDLPFQCDKGHITYLKYRRALNAKKDWTACPECRFEKVKENLANKGCFLQIQYAEWEGHKRRYPAKCLFGHDYMASVADVNKKAYKTNGCPYCAATQTSSQPEKEMSDYIASLGFQTQKNVRGILGRYEIDCYISSLQIGFEFNGTYWHSLPGAPERDARKARKAAALGIKLITIKEEDWNKDKDQCKDRKKQILSIPFADRSKRQTTTNLNDIQLSSFGKTLQLFA